MKLKEPMPHPGIGGALAILVGVATVALASVFGGRPVDFVSVGVQFGVVLCIAVGAYWICCAAGIGASLAAASSLLVVAGAAANAFASYFLLMTWMPSLLIPAVAVGSVAYALMLHELVDLEWGEGMLVTAVTVISGLPVAWLVALSG